MESNPKTMKVIICEEIGKVSLREMPISKPGSGEVLIQVESTPINPSDLMCISGDYDETSTFYDYPCQIGLEGSGTVVESGGGFMGWKLDGKRVAFSTAKPMAWAEYVVVDTAKCMVLDEDETFDEAAASFVNPATACAFFEICNDNKYKAAVLTAASSSLGKMILRLFKDEGIKTIAVIRSEDHRKDMEINGANIILNQNDENFQKDMQRFSKDYGARVMFDCVGGDLTGMILKNMPEMSVAYVYGVMASMEVKLDAKDMLFNQKQVRGFYLTKWMAEQSVFTQMMIMRKISKNILTIFKSKVVKYYKLSEINEAIEAYKSAPGQGKVLLKPRWN